MSNGPINRKKNVTGKASNDSMQTHGPGQGQGPVGSKDGYQQRKTQQARPTQQRPATQRPTTQRTGGQRAGSGGGMGKFIIIAIIALLLGGGGLSGLFGGGTDGTGSTGNTGTTATTTTTTNTGSGNSALSSLLSGGLSSLLGSGNTSGLSDVLGGSWFSSQTNIGASSASSSSGQVSQSPANSTALNRNVAAGSRAKYTAIKGNGKDKVTVMVYMCGADLESKSGMATSDLNEMLSAKFGSSLKLIVYTGGCSQWRNNKVSSQVNQIWQIENGTMKCLEANAGTGVMTNYETLASFIQYGAKNFKANRYALILWDHGSGSVTGYGYDERNPRAGSMSLAGLNSAFKAGGIKFDFIGFDTCLMASVENALMAANYADYLIASEETEPGIGWYYTDWITALGSDTSMATLDIGKNICDDFVSKCANQCRGQQTTLSVIDLAELSNTVPAKLKGFADGITTLVTNKDYKTVSNARNGCREFAASAGIDQVDLTDLCDHMATVDSKALAATLREAVKYNRTNINDAYGLSVYFPYKRVSNVDKAVSTYAAIGMDDSYSRAIRAFASVEASGQAVTGGTASPISSLFGTSSGGSSSSGDLLGSLLSSFLGGGSGMDFLSGRTLDESQMGEYLSANLLDSSKLKFQKYNGQWVIDLAPDQWALVHSIDRNVFYDNGSGYVDLGIDNTFEIDPQTGLLIADSAATWIAINNQPVPYYHESTSYFSDTDWRITGYVPVLLDGDRVNLIIVYDQEHENGYVAGARSVYADEAGGSIAKNMTEIADGAKIVCLVDFYDYQQNFVDSYAFGNPITVSGTLTVSDVELPDAGKARITYRFTDIYNQAYWTPVVGR